MKPACLIMWTDEHGERQLEWETTLRSRVRPLPGRGRDGLMRPARDYAFERAVAKLNRRSA